MKNCIVIALLITLGAASVQASDFDSDFDFYHIAPQREKFQTKKRECKKMLRDVTRYNWDYDRLEADLKNYRTAKYTVPEVDSWVGWGYWRDVAAQRRADIVNNIKKNPEWRKYAEKQMASEQLSEQLWQLLVRKDHANSWSSLFNKYTASFYKWYRK